MKIFRACAIALSLCVILAGCAAGNDTENADETALHTPEAEATEEFALFGSERIGEIFSGVPKSYFRIKQEEKTFELFVTDASTAGEVNFEYETKVIVSDNNGASTVLDVVPGVANDTGLFIEDVDFDGVDDLLVKRGHFGAQGLVVYVCFLNRGGEYELCPSFLDIPNVLIDKENKKILGVWRNWAASHSWAMYEFVNGEFVQTAVLTEELLRDDAYFEEYSAELGLDAMPEEEVWIYIEERQNEERKVFSDFVTPGISDTFYDEGTFWALSSDKWSNWLNEEASTYAK